MDDSSRTGPLVAEPIVTDRLRLEPLAVGHAEEMAAALADPALHAFTGGSPATAAQLRDRYARMVAGPPPGSAETWLNWVIRLTAGAGGPDDATGGGTAGPLDGPLVGPRVGPLVGHVQATLTPGEAFLAWVVGTPWQGRKVAVEAARAMTGWLAGRGVTALAAAIHPRHAASIGVARRLGLVPTAERADGEVVWRSAPQWSPRTRG
ncbi:GNAT family N-acetyltransferase [Planomonospora corallina]|uniref:GNAT family N-acetyltransferase n=1 Tax=Planomonospora corallina TaxID=1806052 RepID=A0ABV8HY46_9ACTN